MQTVVRAYYGQRAKQLFDMLEDYTDELECVFR
jgi:hypothetical protein